MVEPQVVLGSRTCLSFPFDVRLPIPLFGDIQGSDMKKIHLVGFYQLGFWLGQLRTLKAATPTLANYQEYLDPLLRAKSHLEQLCHQSAPLVPIKVCLASAQRLISLIDSVMKKTITPEQAITAQDIDGLNTALTTFETIFAAEMPDIAAYFVSEKRNYSTKSLIENADNEFSESVRDRLPEICISDLRTAGKCIAFELGTAAGFHSYRALEAVAKDYVFNLKKLPELLAKKDYPTLYDFLKKIEDNNADPKVVRTCQDIRELRRNPLAHPDASLTPDEGIHAFKISTSAIEALVGDMEKRSLYSMPPKATSS
jgi:hypothetical protein